MTKWLIKYGIGGGYNDDERYEIIDAENQTEADSVAYDKAVETFEEYDVQMEADEDDEEAYNEERDSWMEYSAELYDEEKHKDIELYN